MRSGSLSIMASEAMPFLAGLAVGALLFALGALVGFFLGRRRRAGGGEAARVDRRRVLRLLRELGTWTREYRGGVAEYQQRLGEITSEARQADGPVAVDGVLPLVERLMQNNRVLQERLDAAEKQLEEQTQQIESTLSEARTDPLTGLANRRALDQSLDELFDQFQRNGSDFALALIDIDHFKPINDTHGHQVGDDVLRQIGARLLSGIREPYLIARYGGEEFAVIFRCSLEEAALRVDSFRRAQAAKPVVSDGKSMTITVSAGVSETAGVTGLSRLVRRADEALYAAKGMGRNRTYFHDGQAPVLLGAPEVVGRS